MSEEKEERVEKIPVTSPLKVIDYRTLSKGFGWWSAAVLVESWGRKQIVFYLWQRKKKGWARKQKFAIRDAQQWDNLVDAASDLLPKLEK